MDPCDFIGMQREDAATGHHRRPRGLLFDDHLVGNPLQKRGLYGTSGELSLFSLAGRDMLPVLLVGSNSSRGDEFDACPVEAMEAVRLQCTLAGAYVWDVEFAGVPLGSGVLTVRIEPHGAETRRVRFEYLREAADPDSVLDEVLSLRWLPRPEGYEWGPGDMGCLSVSPSGGETLELRAFFLGWRDAGGVFDARFLLTDRYDADLALAWHGWACSLSFGGVALPLCECRLEHQSGDDPFARDEATGYVLRAHCGLAPPRLGLLDVLLEDAAC